MLDIQKTKDEIIKDKLIAIDTSIEYTVGVLANSTENLLNQFFKDGEVSPQEFCDVIGVKAQQLFGVLQATQQFLSTIKPDYVSMQLPEIKWSKVGTVEEIILPTEETIV